MQLIFTNNLSKKRYEFDVEDKLCSNLFYTFDLTIPSDMEEGEYTVELNLCSYHYGFQRLWTGIAQVGDYVPSKTEYETTNITENNGYTIYNP